MQMKRREFVGATVGAGALAGLEWPAGAAATKPGGEIRPPDGKFLATLRKLMEIAQLP